MMIGYLDPWGKVKWFRVQGSGLGPTLSIIPCTRHPRAQYPLNKEYSLNHNMKPLIL